MFPDGRRAESARKLSVDPEDVALEPVDVFVDTIIGFLEKSTAYLRTVSNQVFSLLSGSVHDTTIDLILKVCSPIKGHSGCCSSIDLI